MAFKQTSWRLTLSELKELLPDWPHQMIEDYFARSDDGDQMGDALTRHIEDLTNPHNVTHAQLSDISPDQHHNQAHDFLGSDHLNIPFLLDEAPEDGQSYAREGSGHQWNSTYTKAEANQQFFPLDGVDYCGFEGNNIYGGRIA